MLNRASAPFLWLGGAAIVGAGLIAAAIARHPTQPMVWMVAYLVLVVGVVQCVLGAGQAHVATSIPRPATVWTRWCLFNAGSAAVIAGTLAHHFAWVVAGTVLFALAMLAFAAGFRRGRRGVARTALLVLALAMLVSSLVGVFLSLATS